MAIAVAPCSLFDRMLAGCRVLEAVTHAKTPSSAGLTAENPLAVVRAGPSDGMGAFTPDPHAADVCRQGHRLLVADLGGVRGYARRP
jgi:hypothetical protein